MSQYVFSEKKKKFFSNKKLQKWKKNSALAKEEVKSVYLTYEITVDGGMECTYLQHVWIHCWFCTALFMRILILLWRNGCQNFFFQILYLVHIKKIVLNYF